MNLLSSKLYDPASAASKATSSLLALTAFDTTNLRISVVVPAHGKVLFKLRCALTGATTTPSLLFGVLKGATVIGRVVPKYNPMTGSGATISYSLEAEFIATGLTAGAANFDAAYAVQVLVASTNIKYGGPNDASGADAWGGFMFEAWDPQPTAQIVAGVWDELKSAHNVTGSFGSFLDAKASLTYTQTSAIFTRLGAPQGASISADIQAATNQTGGSSWRVTAPTVKQIWDEPKSRHTIAGSFGDNLDAKESLTYARIGAPAGASVSADVAAAKVDTAAIKVVTNKFSFTVTNQVDSNVLGWKSATAPAMTGDAFARLGAPVLASISLDLAEIAAETDAIAAPASAATIAAAVGDATTAAHVTAGTFGKLEKDTNTTIGAAGAGLTALGDTRLAELDAAVSSRLATSGYTAPDNSDIAAIKATIGDAGAGLTALGDARLADLDAAVSSRLATSGYTAPDNSDIAAIKVKTDNLTAAPADETLIIGATNAIMSRLGAPAGASVSADIAAVKTDVDAVPTAIQNADGLLDRANALETGLTMRQAWRFAMSVLGGKLSGAGTGTEVFRNAVQDSKTRVTATVDGSGNRTAIVSDLT